MTSCEVDVTEKFSETGSRFVISGEVLAGESPWINISRSITMTQPDTLYYLDNALVELTVEDQIHQLESRGKGFYSCNTVIPEAGQALRLQCSGEGLPPAYVELSIPEVPVVTDVRFSVNDSFEFTLEADLKDPGTTEDYYTFYISGWLTEINHYYDGNSGEEWWDTSRIYTAYHIMVNDPVVEFTGGPRAFYTYESKDPRGSYFHFSDKLFNGDTHTITATGHLNMIYNDTIPEIRVHVVKKDQHYFNFIRTFVLYDPFRAQDFIQPVQVYTNVIGGFGLVTAANPFTQSIDMTPWFTDPDYLNLHEP